MSLTGKISSITLLAIFGNTRSSNDIVKAQKKNLGRIMGDVVGNISQNVLTCIHSPLIVIYAYKL